MSPTLLRILVLKGFPSEDFKSTRHAAIFLTEQEQGAGDLFHAPDTPQGHDIQILEEYKPSRGLGLAGVASVSLLSKPREELRTILEAVLVDNHCSGRSCQNWVGDALTALVDNDVVTAEERSKALEDMDGILLQAESVV